MHDIVATIQGEQDEVIRSELPGVLVVQGGPGTGKTAVALHRAAYLLYTHRFPLERQGVLVVGPNPVFLRYIGHVLPSLGETGVTLSTISGLVHGVPVRGVDTPATAAVKGDPRMAKVIARAVRNRQRPLREELVVGYGPYRLVLTVADSAEIVAAARRRGGTHNARRKRVERLVAERLYAKYVRGVERARSIDPSVRDNQIQEFSQSLRENDAVTEALDRMWPRLHGFELVHDLFGAKPLIGLATKGILRGDEAALLHRRRSASADDIAWTDADMALIDEADVLLGPVRPLPPDEQFIATFGHVVVDEAQDLTPMQLRMLGRRSLGGSMTIVGDIAQATGQWAPAAWTDVLRHLPNHWHSRQVELTIGYRTPAEAMEMAARVLRETGLGLQPPRPVRSADEVPALVATEVGQLLKELVVVAEREQVLVEGGSVGVVVPASLLAHASAAFDDAAVDYGSTGAKALDAPVTLLPADLAKGLEFDSVVVVEPARILDESRQGLRALYVALTRTTRRLIVLHEQPLPAFLTAP